MPASFLKMSARKGPTPFKYSIGLFNMETELVMIAFFYFLQILTNITKLPYQNFNEKSVFKPVIQ